MTLKSMLSVTCGETTLKIKAINKDCESETINIMRLKSGFTACDASKRADELTETVQKYGDFIVCRVEAVDAYTIKIVCVYP